MKPNRLPAFAGAVLAGGALVALLFFAIGEALASPPAEVIKAALGTNRWAGRQTNAGVFCFSSFTPTAAVNCSANVNAAYGQKLADGGTYNTSDGGQPLIASQTDDLLTFQSTGDLAVKLDFAPPDRCVAVAAVDAGYNFTCDFFRRTVP